MQPDNPQVYRSGELTVTPALGQVEHASGAVIRLGPVNMKVLVALLEGQGRVVSRAELYDAVWGQQLVGEDALTRCISDIRAGLRELSGLADWIETVPKRGYRWRGEEPAVAGQPPPSPRPTAADPGTLIRGLGRGAAYLIGLAVMATLVTWAIDRWTAPGSPVVAVLPVAADDADSALPVRIELELTSYLMEIDGVRVLARSAVATRPANPFPFFYYEFGARWIVESEIRRPGEAPLLTVALVDARTGIVEIQVSAPLGPAADVPVAESEDPLRPLRRYIETALDRPR